MGYIDLFRLFAKFKRCHGVSYHWKIHLSMDPVLGTNATILSEHSERPAYNTQTGLEVFEEVVEHFGAPYTCRNGSDKSKPPWIT